MNKASRIFLAGLGSILLVYLFFFSKKEKENSALIFTVLEDQNFSPREAWESQTEVTITNGRFNPGILITNWWVKAVVKNESNSKGRFFLILNNPHINRIEVYLDGSQTPKWITGDRFPFDSRPYSSRDFVFPIELNPSEHVEVLMKLDKRGETFRIDPEVLGESEFEERRSTEYFIMGLVGGWMLLVIVFTLFFWSELRDRSAFYYALFILFAFLWTFANWGMAFQFLWPEAVFWVGKSRPILTLASFIFFLLTVINFSPPYPNWKLFEVVFRFMIWINFGLLMAFLVIPEEEATPESIAFFLNAVLVLSSIQFLIIGSYLLFHYIKKTPFAGFYLAGIALMMVLFVFINLDQGTGAVLVSHTIFNFGGVFGLMGETALITFAFMRQASLEKKEKEKLAVKILTREKEIANQIILAQEEERNRLGRDLHDSVGGMLGTIHLKLQALAQKNQNPELQVLKDLLLEGIKETRSLSHNLTPPHLENLGLVQALTNQVELLNLNSTIRIKFFHRIDLPISITKEVMIYRIIMELLSNSLKHAKASEIFIQLLSKGDRLELMVEDDGIGFPVEPKKEGIGLKNIQNRVSYLNGELTIDSNPSGTTTLISIPISTEK